MSADNKAMNATSCRVNRTACETSQRNRQRCQSEGNAIGFHAAVRKTRHRGALTNRGDGSLGAPRGPLSLTSTRSSRTVHKRALCLMAVMHSYP